MLAPQAITGVCGADASCSFVHVADVNVSTLMDDVWNEFEAGEAAEHAFMERVAAIHNVEDQSDDETGGSHETDSATFKAVIENLAAYIGLNSTKAQECLVAQTCTECLALSPGCGWCEGATSCWPYEAGWCPNQINETCSQNATAFDAPGPPGEEILQLPHNDPDGRQLSTSLVDVPSKAGWLDSDEEQAQTDLGLAHLKDANYQRQLYHTPHRHSPVQWAHSHSPHKHSPIPSCVSGPMQAAFAAAPPTVKRWVREGVYDSLRLGQLCCNMPRRYPYRGTSHPYYKYHTYCWYQVRMCYNIKPGSYVNQSADGLSAKAYFDISVSVNGQCGVTFSYEESTMHSVYDRKIYDVTAMMGIRGVVSSGLGSRWTSSSIHMTFPGWVEGISYPVGGISGGNGYLYNPSITKSFSDGVWVQAEAWAGIQATAQYVASAQAQVVAAQGLETRFQIECTVIIFTIKV